MADRSAALDWIDNHREEMISFLVEFGNVPSPRGHEHEASEYLLGWLEDRGIEARRQPVVAGRSNVIGRIPGGSGDAHDLVFNAHIDTGFGNREEDEWVVSDHHRIYRETWRDGDYLFGDDAVNDKGPMTAFLWAGLALERVGIDLAGDVTLAGVVGEIGGTTVDEYQDLEYVGSGIGSRRLVDGGVTADYAVVAETTDYAIGRMECGVAWFKVTIEGDVTYQPRLTTRDPGDPLADHPGALPKATRAVEAIERWAGRYSEENTREYDHGTNVPSAGVGAIRSGNPFAPSKAPGKAALYVDVRLPPGDRPESVKPELRRALSEAGIDASIETYLFRRGYVADGEAVEPLVEAVTGAHRSVHDADPSRPSSAVTSMWRDINVFNEVGIPAVTYGPPRSSEEHSGTKHRCLHVDDLVTAAKLYTLTAIEVCGG